MPWYLHPHTVIVDMDGTLANIGHRLHHLEGRKKNWPAFAKGVKNDLLNGDIMFIVGALYAAGAKILVASGRMESQRADTVEWLDGHRMSARSNYRDALVLYEKLYMRKEGDFRPDDVIKLEILKQMHEDGYSPTMAIDDRDRVVEAWRSAGLRCLQVQKGDY